ADAVGATLRPNRGTDGTTSRGGNQRGSSSGVRLRAGHDFAGALDRDTPAKAPCTLAPNAHGDGYGGTPTSRHRGLGAPDRWVSPAQRPRRSIPAAFNMSAAFGRVGPWCSLLARLCCRLLAERREHWRGGMPHETWQSTADDARLGSEPFSELCRKVVLCITEDWFALSHFRPLIAVLREVARSVVVVTRSSGRLGEIEALGARVIDFDFRR